MNENGIDMSRSGWGNPDHHEARKPRGTRGAPPPVAPSCEATHDDGWMCDGDPGHEGTHWADTGAGVIRWGFTAEEGYRPDTLFEIVKEMKDHPAVDLASALAQIRVVAGQAVAEETPVKWAVALEKILEIARDA